LVPAGTRSPGALRAERTDALRLALARVTLRERVFFCDAISMSPSVKREVQFWAAPVLQRSPSGSQSTRRAERGGTAHSAEWESLGQRVGAALAGPGRGGRHASTAKVRIDCGARLRTRARWIGERTLVEAGEPHRARGRRDRSVGRAGKERRRKARSPGRCPGPLARNVSEQLVDLGEPRRAEQAGSLATGADRRLLGGLRARDLARLRARVLLRCHGLSCGMKGSGLGPPSH